MPSSPLLLVLLALSAGCITSLTPLSHDFSDAGQAGSVDLAVDALGEAYSFTEHKELDWEATRAELLAAAQEAEDAGDDEAFDTVIRRLALAIPDGHVALWNDDPERDTCPEADGSLGLRLAELEDGGLMVVSLSAGGPAESAGIELGDLLESWEGLSTDEALDAQALHCFPVGLATNAHRRRGRVLLLGRAPVGEERAMELSRGGQSSSHSLAAEADGHELRAQLDLRLPEERVHAEMVRGDVGLLRIGWEDTVLSDHQAREALRGLWADGARSLVLDLRRNDGGTDQTAANIVGLFTGEEAHYDTITMYDRRTGDQAVVSDVYVQPQEVWWDLPTVVLVDGHTVSSGEGMSRMLAAHPGIEVVGFEGTAASFGSSGSTIRFPRGWELTWPAGRGLDEDGQILLDSDASMEGGVLPTHLIPATADNLLARAADEEGFAVDYAIEHVLGAP